MARVSLDRLVPLHVAIQNCDGHSHIFTGVVSEEPPVAGQVAWVNDETGEFFFPMMEFVTCLS